MGASIRPLQTSLGNIDLVTPSDSPKGSRTTRRLPTPSTGRTSRWPGEGCTTCQNYSTTLYVCYVMSASHMRGEEKLRYLNLHVNNARRGKSAGIWSTPLLICSGWKEAQEIQWIRSVSSVCLSVCVPFLCVYICLKFMCIFWCACSLGVCTVRVHVGSFVCAVCVCVCVCVCVRA